MALKPGILVGLWLSGCATPRPTGPALPAELVQLAQQHRATVVEFFSPTCPCQAAHDGRLRALHADWSGQDVAFVAVDSNLGATAADDARERAARAYPFPLRADPLGVWSAALGATYATFVVVLDAEGRVRYRGGLDGDKEVLHAGAPSWVGRALGQVLAGAPVAPAETKVLGCTLRRW